MGFTKEEMLNMFRAANVEVPETLTLQQIKGLYAQLPQPENEFEDGNPAENPMSTDAQHAVAPKAPSVTKENSHHRDAPETSQRAQADNEDMERGLAQLRTLANILLLQGELEVLSRLQPSPFLQPIRTDVSHIEKIFVCTISVFRYSDLKSTLIA